ncbi:hypothetical protein WR25_07526 [Diploscapter pachys]|uniref:Uncharacterized protein n=1 Tax=Diploscapter pachys TaxID=2018661 RepID=A0A2A2JK62_9BILA|nr:hypothetical protein WR25_07526 [Diploscapter pachys]
MNGLRNFNSPSIRLTLAPPAIDAGDKSFDFCHKRAKEQQRREGGKTAKEEKSLVGKEKDPRSFRRVLAFSAHSYFCTRSAHFLAGGQATPLSGSHPKRPLLAERERAKTGKGAKKRGREKGFVVVALSLCALSDSRRSIFHTEMNRNAKFANRDASI